MSIKVDISVGEFLDKLVILEIKAARINDQAKVANVEAELAGLRATWADSPHSALDLAAPLATLRQVNEQLWDIEDRIRDKERRDDFDAGFIELARSVYVTNDKRAELKRTLNQLTGSTLVEEKSYQHYAAPTE